MSQLHVSKIQIKDVFGIRHLAFDPDGVSIIRGDNETGKTSVLRAILLLLGGGHDPDALRKGAEKGEVRFELEDGTEVYARLTETDTYYRIEGRDDVTARQLLTRLQDEISVNPTKIIRARPQDRGQILLEAMPMTVNANDLSQALHPLKGTVNTDPPHTLADPGTHALDLLGDKDSGLIGRFYDQRQQMYGAKRDKEGTINDLQQSIEQHDDPDELKETRTEAREEVQTLRQTMQELLDAAEEEKDRQVQEVNEWEKREIEKIRRKATERRETAREAHAESVEQTREQYEPVIEEAQKKAERLDEKVEQAEKAKQTKDLIAKREKEYERLEAKYNALSHAIENLRDLRTSFADDLPEGVRVGEDGEIYDLDDIPFENWNEERQVRFAAKIAELRKGELGIIPIDGIETLVGAQREAFLDWAKEADAQFILTEAVADEPLTVEHA